MRIVNEIITGILFLLAVASGATKILLVEQEVIFFGSYGFSSQMLVIFGAIQLLGGNLLLFKKTRIIGASLVAVTFLISAVILFMAQNWTAAGITVAIVLLLGVSTSDQLNRSSNAA